MNHKQRINRELDILKGLYDIEIKTHNDELDIYIYDNKERIIKLYVSKTFSSIPKLVYVCVKTKEERDIFLLLNCFIRFYENALSINHKSYERIVNKWKTTYKLYYLVDLVNDMENYLQHIKKKFYLKKYLNYFIEKGKLIKDLEIYIYTFLYDERKYENRL